MSHMTSRRTRPSSRIAVVWEIATRPRTTALEIVVALPPLSRFGGKATAFPRAVAAVGERFNSQYPGPPRPLTRFTAARGTSPRKRMISSRTRRSRTSPQWSRPEASYPSEP